MKTMIETINGKKVTIIRRPFDAAAVRESLAIGVPVVAEHKLYGRGVLHGITGDFFRSAGMSDVAERFTRTLTILPALPRHPKLEDAALLYRYMAEGLEPRMTLGGRFTDVTVVANIYEALGKITHAVDASGQRVEIAITGEKP